jgi:hypothetical protein
MTSERTSRRVSAVLAAVSDLAVVAALLGVLASLATVNGLFVGTAWRVPALFSVVIVAVTLAVVVYAGASDRWARTPYW